MSPESHSLYSLFLYSALVSLMHWSSRRHRLAHQFRQGMAEAISTRKPSREWESSAG